MSEKDQGADLLMVVGSLAGILERETAMLREMRPSEIQSLQQEKIALTAAYEAQVGKLKGEPERLAAMSPEMRAEIKATVGKFETTLANNERRLGAAKAVTERVLRAIADEIGRQSRGNDCYSPLGLSPGAARSEPARSPLSVAYDERL